MAATTKGSKVWIPTASTPGLEKVAPTLPWLAARVIGEAAGGPEGTTVEVEVEPPHASLGDVFVVSDDITPPERVAVDANAVVMRADDDDGVDDLVNSDILHEPSVLYTLGIRYALDDIYTYSGQILIAVNPFKPLKHLYGPAMMSQYYDKFLGELSPHVYAIAEQAFKSMLIEEHAQSILISGESGAGKTESAKLVMQYLAMRHLALASSEEGGTPPHHRKHANGTSTNGQSVSPFTPGLHKLSTQGASTVEQQVLESNPLLEAFGNANTIRNANSSRFGKYVQLHFTPGGKIHDASVQTYLLERSRLVQVSQNERNYHVFYQLLAGASTEQKQAFHLEGLSPSDFAYLSSSDTYTLDGVDDGADFAGTMQAMAAVKIGASDREDVLKVVAAVLHLGNITFSDALESHSAVMDGSLVEERCERHLVAAADLLGVSRDALEQSLTTRTIVAPDNVYRKGLQPSDAFKARDAFTKTLYIKLFDWIVCAINQSMGADEAAPTHGNSNNRSGAEGRSLSIGILDIYGFESFERNSFEQLCINLANEHLQQHFNEQVLRFEQEEYAKEGIEWDFIDFKDNQSVLDLIVGVGGMKGLSGIMPILDECCRLPRTTASDLSQSLANKLGKNDAIAFHKKHPVAFEVIHYAGSVLYDARGMIEKNKDYIVLEHTTLAEASAFPFFKALFIDASQKANSAKTFQLKTVSSHFRIQLRSLMADLRQTQPNYIRCVKPNYKCLQGHFVSGYVHEQLCYGGVMEAIRIARCGFPSRKTFADFVQRYSVLIPSTSFRGVGVGAGGVGRGRLEGMDADELKHLCQKILQAVHVDGWAFGRTKVFCKEGSIPLLETRRSALLESAATRIQAAYRAHRTRERIRRMVRAAVRIQAAWRGVVGQRALVALRREAGATRIQAWWRMATARAAFLGVRRNNKAIIIQAYVRGILARKRSEAAKFAIKRRQQRCAAVRIQSEWRRVLACRLYASKRAKLAYVSGLEKTKDELSDRIARMGEELEAERTRRVQAEASLAEAERGLQGKLEEMAALRERVQAMSEERMSAMECTHAEAVAAFQEELEAERTRRMQTEASLGEARGDAASKDDQIFELRDRVQALTLEVDGMRSLEQAHAESTASMQDEFEAERTKRAKAEALLDEARGDTASKDEQVTELRERVEALTRDKDAAGISMEQAHAESTAALQDELASLRSEKESVTSGLEAKLASRVEQEERLGAELRDAKSELASKNDELRDLNAAMAALKMDLLRAHADVEALRAGNGRAPEAEDSPTQTANGDTTPVVAIESSPVLSFVSDGRAPHPPPQPPPNPPPRAPQRRCRRPRTMTNTQILSLFVRYRRSCHLRSRAPCSS